MADCSEVVEVDGPWVRPFDDFDAFLASVWSRASKAPVGSEWDRVHLVRVLMDAEHAEALGTLHSRDSISVLHVAVLFDRQLINAALCAGARLDEPAYTPMGAALRRERQQMRSGGSGTATAAAAAGDDGDDGVDDADSRTYTPLEVALLHNRAEAAVLLLQYGATVRGIPQPLLPVPVGSGGSGSSGNGEGAYDGGEDARTSTWAVAARSPRPRAFRALLEKARAHAIPYHYLPRRVDLCEWRGDEREYLLDDGTWLDIDAVDRAAATADAADAAAAAAASDRSSTSEEDESDADA